MEPTETVTNNPPPAEPQATQTQSTAPSAPAKRVTLLDRMDNAAREAGLLADPKTATPNQPAPEDKTKTATAAPEDADVPEEIRKSPKASENFKKLSGKVKEWETKYAALEGEYKKKTAAPVKWEDLPEVQALRKERDEFSEKLKLVDIEKHPKFQEYFDRKATQALENATKIGGKQGDKLASIMRLPDSPWRTEQLDAVLSEMSPSQQAKMGAVLLEWDNVHAERANELSKYKEAHEKLTKQEAQERALEMTRKQEETRSAFSRVVSEATDKEKGVFIFQKIEGNDAHNANVDKMLKTAEQLMGDVPTDERARAALWAVSAPELLRDGLAKAQEIATLKKQLAEFQAARPSPGGGSENRSAPSGTQSLVERVVSMAQNSGATR